MGRQCYFATARIVGIESDASVADHLAFGCRATPASDEQVQDAVTKASSAAGDLGYPLRFVLSEWRHVVDAWLIADMDAYAGVPCLSRKSQMSAGQRERL